ncbi:MAG: antitoxin [Candidatus Marinimicrobia bacterium]|nr:antitoxin [Candidatus Neomarinimicrobiota bacterium]MCH8023698.1 antitoxin [Candidatus Neomarinimicrobiota bacterium]
MEIKKSFIVDDDGEVQSVILDYKSYKKIEELLLDYGLLRAMEEVAEEEEIDLKEAKVQLHFTE